ncbi:hypothetical protein SASPL_111387 [Salvia splendens]|uniref:Uncharacterized protein n=1 Tax=Salvia splendens TaxID=180675 RepID=A0A8X8YAN5_SALSN|nr:hypothetical protein SASPL_111387 [Salvia splendens]
MNNENSQAVLDQMKGAILEVLLVSAKGIDRTHILGHPGYHVIVECGSQEIWENSTGMKSLCSSCQNRAGESEPSETQDCERGAIFIKGIIVEGNYKGLAEILPAPFNVMLEDDTYKGRDDRWNEVHTECCCERGREAMREEGKRCRINMLCDHKHLETQVVEAFLFL